MLKFERDENGNDLADMSVDDRILKQLAGRRASDLVWVTFSRENAMRYADPDWQEQDEPTMPERYDLGENARIVAEDGDGGYLILMDPQATAAAAPKASDALTVDERQMLKDAGYQDTHLEMLNEDELQQVLAFYGGQGEDLDMDLIPPEAPGWASAGHRGPS